MLEARKRLNDGMQREMKKLRGDQAILNSEKKIYSYIQFSRFNPL